MNTSIRALGTLVAMLASSWALAALPIELEVATEAGVSLTAPQQWAVALGKLDLASVRLRSARPGERPEITLLASGRTTGYRVLALLSAREELILPDARFRRNQSRALQTYFEQLPQAALQRQTPVGRFGLTEADFRAVHADLALPIGLSTQGRSIDELLNHLEKKFATPQFRDPAIRSATTSAAMEVELSPLSAGTALAMALRREGLVLRPERPHGKRLRLAVARYERQRESWPVGWKPPASPRQLAPKLYDRITLEIEHYTLQQSLDALAPRLGVPVFFDDWTLARLQIQPDEVSVQLSRKERFLKLALDRLLSQARLASELRVDEQGQPFLWITQFGPDSRPAE